MVASRASFTALNRSLAHLLAAWRDDVLRVLAFVLRRPLTLAASYTVVGRDWSNETSDRTGNEAATNPSTEALKVRRARSVDRELLSLRIPTEHVLSRRLTIPAAAAADLAVVVANNLEVWTPFAPEDVYAAAVETDDRGSTREIELRCVLRALARAEIDRHQEHGLHIDAVELSDERFRIPFDTMKHRRIRRSAHLKVSLALLAVVQLVVLVGLLHHRQEIELTALTQELQARARRAHEQTVLAAKVEQSRRALATVASAHNEQGLARYLATLAEALPEGTYLRELEVSNEKGRMVVVGPAQHDVESSLSRTGVLRILEASQMGSAVAGERVQAFSFSRLRLGERP